LVSSFGLGSNIGHGLFVGWVEHPDIFCWVSFLYPTYLSAIFVLSAEPNKMAEKRTIPHLLFRRLSAGCRVKYYASSPPRRSIFPKRLRRGRGDPFGVQDIPPGVRAGRINALR